MNKERTNYRDFKTLSEWHRRLGDGHPFYDIDNIYFDTDTNNDYYPAVLIERKAKNIDINNFKKSPQGRVLINIANKLEIPGFLISYSSWLYFVREKQLDENRTEYTFIYEKCDDDEIYFKLYPLNVKAKRFLKLYYKREDLLKINGLNEWKILLMNMQDFYINSK